MRIRTGALALMALTLAAGAAGGAIALTAAASGTSPAAPIVATHVDSIGPLAVGAPTTNGAPTPVGFTCVNETNASQPSGLETICTRNAAPAASAPVVTRHKVTGKARTMLPMDEAPAPVAAPVEATEAPVEAPAPPPAFAPIIPPDAMAGEPTK